jgi:hypothetical protein
MASSFWNYVIQIWAGIFKPLWRSTQNLCFNSSISKLSYMQNYHSCTLGQNIFLYSTIHKNATVVCVLYVYRVKWGPLFGQCTKGGWAARALVGLSLEGPHVCISGNSVKFLGYWSPGLASYYNQRQADSCQDEWEGRERGKTHGHCGQPAGSKSNVYVMYICIYSIL